MQNQFREALQAGTFALTYEIVPGRGAAEATQESLINTVHEVWATGLVQAISITDNAGGNSALPAFSLACEFARDGIEPLVHFTCRDRNRVMAESQLYAAQRAGVSNLLCMTGDYVNEGFKGFSRPVFDLDPITMLQLVAEMNKGMGYPNRKGELVRTKPADFFAGAAVSPFKWTEAEVMTQFFKAKKKVHAGAQFLISQVGYDARKLQEMMFMLEDAGMHVPVIANIYLMNAGVGAVMNRGAIPGCYVSDAMLADLRAARDASADKGREATLELAAKMIAIAKGLGCAGAHIGGSAISAQELAHIVELAQAAEATWQEELPAMSYPAPDSFYYYEQDPETGLNTHVPNARPEQHTEKAIRGNYKLSRTFHKLVFVPNKGFNKTFVAHEKKLETKKGRLRKHGLEHASKAKLYGCANCGDCGLYATAYSCPMVECPKAQRNGACGGSKDGWCEVYPGEKYCVWYKAYYRLKAYGEEATLGDYIVPPNDWKNYAKSAWGANVLEQDGYSKREFLR